MAWQRHHDSTRDEEIFHNPSFSLDTVASQCLLIDGCWMSRKTIFGSAGLITRDGAIATNTDETKRERQAVRRSQTSP